MQEILRVTLCSVQTPSNFHSTNSSEGSLYQHIRRKHPTFELEDWIAKKSSRQDAGNQKVPGDSELKSLEDGE